MLFNILLIIHIIGGFLALISSVFAVGTKWLNRSHRWHVWSGRVYHWGMITVFVTAVPMTFLNPNLFLFLIAIFSYYLVFVGWRLAVNRKGKPEWMDWTASGLMLLAAAGMLIYALNIMVVVGSPGPDVAIILMVFGGIGVLNAGTDLRHYWSGGLKGRERIAEHLVRMMGGTIATLTAFVVTNFYVEPIFILWLGPTVLITPIIFYWSRQVRGKGRGLIRQMS